MGAAGSNSGATPGRGYRIGVDIGGTFTDVVLMEADGTLSRHKLSSTPDDYGRAILVGIRALLAERALDPDDSEEIVHGTTVATNAILEHKGARTALVTTRGFRDVLELRRIRIPELYNLFYEKPEPLVPRRLRFEVDERIGPHGETIEPLSKASVTYAIERLRTSGVEAVAVCLLHSYVNDVHEREVGEMIAQALPDVYVTCSAEILPEIREYERSSTAVINSYLGPTVDRYLRALGKRLNEEGLRAPLLVMQSNGGIMTADVAAERPAQMVESGPAAGVIAVQALALRAGYRNVITLDMGGTTAKASAIEGGEVTQTSEYEVGAGINISSLLVSGGGYALKLPAIDVSEIGAGGGSIVWVDSGGRLQIGPQSAGAVPGPACYGAGGVEATVTDANVALGYINPSSIAGGGVRLHIDKAREALEERVARVMALPLLEAAFGVHAVASEKMVRSVKAVSTYRGRDPRDSVLFAFGGSGPIHAAGMARSLGIGRVVVPPAAGLLSAVGLLCSNIEHQSVRTFLRHADADAAGPLSEAFAELEGQALAILGREGYARDRIVFNRFADLRYVGQGFELAVPVAKTALLNSADVASMAERFGEEHLRTYGHRGSSEQVEVMNVRLNARVNSLGPAPHEHLRVGDHGKQLMAERQAYFGREYGLLVTPVLGRSQLVAAAVQGPAIIEDYDSTCVIPPGCGVSADEWGNVVIDLAN
jgi:N-methylhydantoinase A